MLFMELFMKTRIVLQQQGCFFTSSILLSSSEHSRYIQYLSSDLWKISVLSRCGLHLINSKIWTFTYILVCEWWAKCLLIRVKGFANTDGGAFCGSVACLMFLKCS